MFSSGPMGPVTPRPPPFVIDSRITLSTSPEIPLRRSFLIANAWGTLTLPTTMPTVTTGVSNPFPSYNVSRVDQYVASMSNGQSNTSNLYVANTSSQNRLVILNPGHQSTCDWTTFAAGYRIQLVLQALLNAGFDVFAMNMPACGDATMHVSLFSTYGDRAMQYFIEPLVQMLNYQDAHASYLSYDAVGLSGGAWTATIAAALDPRIRISIPVAGSMPGVQFVPGSGNSPNHGDGSNVVAEQNNTDYYTIAGFLDHYIMAAWGTNRQHLQILNFSDSCCYGNSQWTDPSFNYQTYYGQTFQNYTSDYASKIAAVHGISPLNYSLTIDVVADQHQISTFAQALILSTL